MRVGAAEDSENKIHQGLSLVTKAAATFPIFVELKHKRQEMTTSPWSQERARSQENKKVVAAAANNRAEST